MPSLRLAAILLPPALLLLLLPAVQGGGRGPCAPADVDDFACTPQTADNTFIPLDSRNYVDLDVWSLGSGWTISDLTDCQNQVRFCAAGFTPGDSNLTTQCIDTSEYIGATVLVEIAYVTEITTAVPPIVVSGTDVTHEASPYMSWYTATSENRELIIAPSEDLTAGCVTLEYVRVSVSLCPSVVRDYVVFPNGTGGQSLAVSCIDDASGSPGMATCNSSSMTWGAPSGDVCQCDPGFEGSSGMECVACNSGNYKNESGNGACETCPANSQSNAAFTSCTCNAGYRRENPDNITMDCAVCDTNYYRKDGECRECPAGSQREISAAEDECMCEGDLTTPDGSTTTTGTECSGCKLTHFRDGNECQPCASNSMSASFDATFCTCNGNLVTQDGSNDAQDSSDDCDFCREEFYKSSGTLCVMCPENSFGNSLNVHKESVCQCADNRATSGGLSTTTSDSCSGCIADFYLTGGECEMCPFNSSRPADDSSGLCVCDEGYSRKNPNQPQTPCLPVINFVVQEATVAESEGEVIFDISISAPPINSVMVVIMIDDAPPRVPTFRLYLNCCTVENQPWGINIKNDFGEDDDKALEEDVVYTLPLSSDEAVIGPGASLNLTIEDDDTVTVGFTTQMLSVNKSDAVTVPISISTDIATDLVLELMAQGLSSTVRFEAGQGRFIDHRITIGEDVTYSITFNVTEPADLKPGVVIFGDGTNTYEQLTLLVIDDEGPTTSDGGGDDAFGIGAVIGIAVGGIGLAVLVILIILVLVVICRIRVNQQGYYATDEDKQEQPTMLRYSASLRSISSQTVVPVDGGRAEPKENEFYV